jgi:N-sulfoglucosamine sulfohydrolase
MPTYNYKRRDFLRTVAAPAILTTVARGQAAPRPNILFAIADDWSWPYASIAGHRAFQTPSFDRVARSGVMFRNAFVTAPSCTPSRASILTGQWHWRLEEGANLYGPLKAKFDVYPDLLERAGYHVGYTGKGWGPGNWKEGGRKRNPAGLVYNERTAAPPAKAMSKVDYAANFADFLKARPGGRPFCFWYGGSEPHRAYEKGIGRRAGKKLSDIEVPACLPDVEEVRSDMLDYAVEVEWFDTHLGRMLETLEKTGELDNTLIAVTGDNGLPFPRCKSNLYDTGTLVPLAVCWGDRIQRGRTVDDFVSLSDLCPTFLEVCGLKPTPAMTARSFLDVLRSGKSGRVDPRRSSVLTGKERHVPAQPDSLGGYPMRAIRTDDCLYIRNFHPERFPGGADNTPGHPFWDVDASPTKDFVTTHRNDAKFRKYFELAFGKRPAEELYDLKRDPGQIDNVAGKREYAQIKAKLSSDLMAALKATGDPRASGHGDVFDSYPWHTNR